MSNSDFEDWRIWRLLQLMGNQLHSFGWVKRRRPPYWGLKIHVSFELGREVYWIELLNKYFSLDLGVHSERARRWFLSLCSCQRQTLWRAGFQIGKSTILYWNAVSIFLFPQMYSVVLTLIQAWLWHAPEVRHSFSGSLLMASSSLVAPNTIQV